MPEIEYGGWYPGEFWIRTCCDETVIGDLADLKQFRDKITDLIEAHEQTKEEGQ